MVKVKFSKSGLKKYDARLKELTRIDKKTAQEIGRIVVEETREMTSKGISPIRGRGRFPGYKAVTEGNDRGYPMNQRRRHPGKRKRPVNLRLSNNFMAKLRFKVSRGRGTSWITTVGWWDRKNILKERGHREGANGQPPRPVIPEGDETYAVKITKRIYDVLQQRVRRIVRTGRG